MQFIYPERLLRLRFAYPNVPDKTIRAYYKTFANITSRLNANPEIFADLSFSLDNSLKQFIESELLPPDSSALQFGQIKVGIIYTDNYDDILSDLYNLYFTVFEHTSNLQPRIDEAQLLQKYKTLIREFDTEIFESPNEKLKLNYIIKPSDTKEFKFDIAWQNQTLNLVKPISFDVKRHETIINKAYRFYGQFMDLENFAESQNYRFDLLLARPKAKALFRYYDNAISLLAQPKQVKLIEEDGLKEYSIKTISAISESNI